MILWLILFLLIVGVSFILAFRSMKDYQEIPQASKVEYGLFLIRQTGRFDTHTLDLLGRLILDEGLIISLERLFKGKQVALTIYGPKKIMDKFTQDLNLLELEDYMQDVVSQDISIWELGVRDSKKLDFSGANNIFQNLSGLGNEDQFFWQIMLSAKKGDSLSFQTQIRAVIYTKDTLRRKQLASALENVKVGELTKIPKPFSGEQMMNFYKLRSLGKDSNGPILDSRGVMQLLKV